MGISIKSRDLLAVSNSHPFYLHEINVFIVPTPLPKATPPTWSFGTGMTSLRIESRTIQLFMFFGMPISS